MLLKKTCFIKSSNPGGDKIFVAIIKLKENDLSIRISMSFLSVKNIRTSWPVP
jgi:hypothetical protein